MTLPGTRSPRTVLGAIVLALAASACGDKQQFVERPFDEAFRDVKPGWWHVHAATPASIPSAGPTKRTYEAIAAEEGVFTLQYAMGLPDAERDEDAGVLIHCQALAPFLNVCTCPSKAISVNASASATGTR